MARRPRAESSSHFSMEAKGSPSRRRWKMKRIRSAIWCSILQMSAPDHVFPEKTRRWARLGILCQRLYNRADYPGYLTMGVPMQYGAGASEVMRELVADPRSKHKLIGDLLRHGDIERALVEWRSLLRRIVTAPPYPLPRWNELKTTADELIGKTVSPTTVDLAGLLPVQQRRVL